MIQELRCRTILNDPEMLRDDNLYPMTARGVTVSPNQDEEAVRLPEEEINYANDDLDSVFGSGSEAASPILSPVDVHTDASISRPRDAARTHSGDGPAPRVRRKSTEISDVPRLREKHETEGYRDGVTEGKAKFIQNGFDEGYTLGAVLGLRIGEILGLLEGLAGAYGSGSEMDKLWAEAKDELKAEKVFSKDYWDEEGIWKWNVPGETQDGQIVFEDVVKAHPLVKKWEDVVDVEIKKCGVDLEVWAGEEGIVDEDTVARRKGVKPVGDLKEEVTPAAPKILGVQREKLSW